MRRVNQRLERDQGVGHVGVRRNSFPGKGNNQNAGQQALLTVTWAQREESTVILTFLTLAGIRIEMRSTG